MKRLKRIKYFLHALSFVLNTNTLYLFNFMLDEIKSYLYNFYYTHTNTQTKRESE